MASPQLQNTPTPTTSRASLGPYQPGGGQQCHESGLQGGLQSVGTTHEGVGLSFSSQNWLEVGQHQKYHIEWGTFKHTMRPQHHHHHHHHPASCRIGKLGSCLCWLCCPCRPCRYRHLCRHHLRPATAWGLAQAYLHRRLPCHLRLRRLYRHTSRQVNQRPERPLHRCGHLHCDEQGCRLHHTGCD